MDTQNTTPLLTTWQVCEQLQVSQPTLTKWHYDGTLVAAHDKLRNRGYTQAQVDAFAKTYPYAPGSTMLSRVQAAKQLGVGQSTLTRWHRDGIFIPSHRYKYGSYYSPEDIETLRATFIPTDKGLLNCKQAANRLGISQGALGKWHHNGKLVAAYTFNLHRGYTLAQLDAFAKQYKPKAPAYTALAPAPSTEPTAPALKATVSFHDRVKAIVIEVLEEYLGTR